MPNTPYVQPVYVLTDADTRSVLKESLDRAIITRQNILEKPKPSYDIDGQKFMWSEYLKVLNDTIDRLKIDIQDLDSDSPFEIESQAYSI